MKKGFDTDLYLKKQTEEILNRIKHFKNKLYLEIGGKLYADYHAARVLPGFDPDAKIKILNKIKDNIEIIYCIGAPQLEEKKIRGHSGLSYNEQAIKEINHIKNKGLDITKVVISQYKYQKQANLFKEHLENLGFKVYTHHFIQNYPNDLNNILSEEGYGKQEHIKTKKKIVVVIGTGPGSGKLSTCLTNIYLDSKKGMDSGYAKLETFPIWNLELKHPINIAYESATADLGDYNIIDPFHLKAYNKETVNYNRDVEAFKIIKKMFSYLVSEDNYTRSYKSPTDMGINMAGFAITDDEIVREAAKQEIVRRYFDYKKNFLRGKIRKKVVERAEKIMKEIGLSEDYRKVVEKAREAMEECKEKNKGHKMVYCGTAIMLNNGEMIKGKNSELLHSESSAILNAIKKLANISDEKEILDEEIIKQVNYLKRNILKKGKLASLNVEETLVCLAVSAYKNKNTKKAFENIKKLRDCELHSTHMFSGGDESGLRKLKMNATTDGRRI
ncbi:DUF1846 family protein [Candidatus Woesearchaeota archaeon]|nr:DUF1846 family protein [Candidatus Woesearchaeota archaeon]